MYVCLDVCMYVCMCVFVYVCMFVCMSVCSHVCVYLCMYVCSALEAVPYPRFCTYMKLLYTSNDREGSRANQGKV